MTKHLRLPLTALLISTGAISSTAFATGLTIDSRTLSLKVGQSNTLTATESSSGQPATDVLWSSSNPTIATVDDTGLVSVLKVGYATITATANSGQLSGVSSVLVNANAESVQYKEFTYNDNQVVRVYYPAGWKASDQRPAAVFFHGGSWDSGSYYQNMPHAQYLASRGFVAMTAQYRLDAVANTVIDARSCMRWAKTESAHLGIDPTRVVAGGSSAGGHLAMCCYTGAGIDDPDDNLEISTRPDLLLLFDGALYLHGSRYTSLTDAFGTEIAKGSQPTREDVFGSDAPPTIMFYGNEDSRRHEGHYIHNVYLGLGIDAEYWLAEGESHGFSDATDDWRNESFYLMDRFLIKHGYLSGEPGKVLTTKEPRMENIILGGTKKWLVTPQTVLYTSAARGSAGRTIDGSGIEDPRVLQNSEHSNLTSDMWSTGGEPEAEIVYDLGEQMDLRGIHLWNNASAYGENSPDSIEILVSESGDLDAEFVSKTVIEPLKGGAFAQNFALNADSVRLVKLLVTRQWAPTGFAEIRFSTASFPPRILHFEPSEQGALNVSLAFDGEADELEVKSSENLSTWQDESALFQEVDPGVFETELNPNLTTSIYYRFDANTSE